MDTSNPGNVVGSKMQPVYLGIAVALMLFGSVYPLMMLDGHGSVDHRLVMSLMLAMSSGFVLGVGFIPRTLVWRWLFSGWTCIGSLILAAAFKFFL